MQLCECQVHWRLPLWLLLLLVTLTAIQNAKWLCYVMSEWVSTGDPDPDMLIWATWIEGPRVRERERNVMGNMFYTLSRFPFVLVVIVIIISFSSVRWRKVIWWWRGKVSHDMMRMIIKHKQKMKETWSLRKGRERWELEKVRQTSDSEKMRKTMKKKNWCCSYSSLVCYKSNISRLPSPYITSTNLQLR